MENISENWGTKIFGSQFNPFTMEEDVANTGPTEVDASKLNALSDSSYDEQLYAICVMVEQNIAKLKKPEDKSVAGKLIKRELEPHEEDKDDRNEESPEKIAKMNTNDFKIYILSQNRLKIPTKQYIAATESTYSRKVMTYQIGTENDEFGSISADDFVNSVSDTILFLIKKIIDQHNVFHVGFVLHVDLRQSKKTFEIATVKSMFIEGDNLQTYLTHLHNTISNKISAVESKFECVRIKFIEMVVVTVLQKVTSDSWQMSIEGGHSRML